MGFGFHGLSLFMLPFMLLLMSLRPSKSLKVGLSQRWVARGRVTSLSSGRANGDLLPSSQHTAHAQRVAALEPALVETFRRSHPELRLPPKTDFLARPRKVCDPFFFDHYCCDRAVFEKVRKRVWETGIKNYRVLTTVFASSGMGKSRFLDELAVDPGIAEDTVVLPITFGTSVFALSKEERKLRLGEFIVPFNSRLLFAYFLDDDERSVPRNALSEEFKAFVAFMIKEHHMMDVIQAVALIKQHMSGLVELTRGEDYGRSFNKTRLLICVDEIMKLRPKKHAEYLLNELCSLTYQNNDTAFVTSTVNKDILRHLLPRTVEHIPLFPLSFEACCATQPAYQTTRSLSWRCSAEVICLLRSLVARESAEAAQNISASELMDVVSTKLNSSLKWEVVEKLLLPTYDMFPHMNDGIARGTVMASFAERNSGYVYHPMVSLLHMRKWALEEIEKEDEEEDEEDEEEKEDNVACQVKALLRDIFERLSSMSSYEFGRGNSKNPGHDFMHVYRCAQMIRMLLEYKTGSTETYYYEQAELSMLPHDTTFTKCKTAGRYDTKMFPAAEEDLAKELQFPDDISRDVQGHNMPRAQDIVHFANSHQQGFDYCVFHQSTDRGLVVEAVDATLTMDARLSHEEMLDAVLKNYDLIQKMKWSQVDMGVEK